MSYINLEDYIKVVKDVPMWGGVAVYYANRMKKEDLRENTHGKWEYTLKPLKDDDGPEIVEGTCSVCHDYKETFAKWIYDDGGRVGFKYCPECGAEMEDEP